MIKEVITYPTPPSVEYATDVRLFNEELFSLIDDLKESINENGMDGLAAYQIGSYFNVVVIKKEDGSFLELINPRLISTNGKITTIESTAYFAGLTAEVTRYDNISIVYQDRESKQQYLKAEGAFAVLLQRKIDYTFGATFLSKLSKSEKAIFEKKLEYGSNIAIPESCPTTFRRDYLVKLSNILMITIALTLVVSLFISTQETLLGMWKYQLYTSYAVVGVNIVYFFYAQYESKKYTSCTSCQIGNIIGTTFLALVKLTLLMLLSYFLVNPL